MSVVLELTISIIILAVVVGVAEIVMRETVDGGVSTGGRRVSNLRYADDIILLASSEAEL